MKTLTRFFIFLFVIKTSLATHFPFIENKGQLPDKVISYLNFTDRKIFLEKGTVTYLLFHPDSVKLLHPKPYRDVIIPAHAFRQKFLNTNSLMQISKQNASPYYENYFIGNDPSKWARNVKRHQVILYKNFYENIDLKWYFEGDLLKYDFIVRAGANPEEILWQYEGIELPEIDEEGNLILPVSVGDIIEQKPLAYQIIEGKKVFVKCEFRRKEQGGIGFFFPEGYDKKYELVIDPALVFATYSGSFADNWGYTSTYDDAGNMYIGGMASGTGYPATTGAFQTVYNGGVTGASSTMPIWYPMDMAFMKISPDGTSRVWATYVGGSNNEQPHSIICNSNDELFVLGATASSDFPVTTNAFDVTYNGNTDIVLLRINNTGTQLIGSTFLGGTGVDGLIHPEFTPLYYFYADDGRGEIKLDKNENPVIVSITYSPNFPTLNAFAPTYSGAGDGVVCGLDASLQTLRFATFFGGSGEDACYGLDFSTDSSDIIIVGGSLSNDLPVSPGAYDVSPGNLGTPEGYIAILDSTASQLKRMTYFGTDSYDQVYFVQYHNGALWFVGHTEGFLNPVGNVWSLPGRKQFVGRINYDLDSLELLTTYGRTTSVEPRPLLTINAFMVDKCNKVYVSGWGGPPFLGNSQLDIFGLYTTPNAFQSTTDGRDFYIIVFEPDLSAVHYATYLGGPFAREHVDGGTSRFSPQGIIYQNICGGCTGLSDFPTFPANVISPTNMSSNCNNLAVKFDLESIFYAQADANFNVSFQCNSFVVNFQNSSQQAGSFFWDFGDGNTSTDPNPTHTYTQADTYYVTLIAYPPANIPVTCKENDTLTLPIILPVNPYGDFSFKNYCDSGRVDFQIDTLGNIVKFVWDFGNGVKDSSGIDTTIYYPATDTYTVSLFLSTGTCDTTITRKVFAIRKPDMSISADTLPCLLEIPFTTDTSNPYVSPIIWEFSDGTIDTANSVVHTFPDAGNYTVTITKQIDTCSYSEQHPISIREHSVADYNLTLDTCKKTLIVTNQSRFSTTSLLDFGTGDTLHNLTSTSYEYPYADSSYVLTFITEPNIPTCADTLQDTIKIPPIALADFFLEGEECNLTQTLNATNSLADSLIWRVNGNIIGNDSVEVYTFPYNGVHSILLIALLPDSPSECKIDTMSLDTLLGNTSVADFLVNINCLNVEFINRSTYDTSKASGTIWQWDFGDGTTSLLENPSHIFPAEGSYDVTLIVRPGTYCEARKQQTLSLKAPPALGIKVVSKECEYIPIFINIGDNQYQTIWTIDGQTFTGNEITFPKYESLYQVNLTVIRDGSCTASMDTLVKGDELLREKLFIPNCFTPNGDGINELFEIKGKDIHCLRSLSVFDRWGNRIYYSDTQPLAWDGNKQNGKPAPEGVYVYVVEKYNGEKRVGTLTLLR